MVRASAPTSSYAVAGAAVLLVAIGGCALQPPTKGQSQAALNKKLAVIGPVAEDSFYACLLSGLAQGLPIQRASDDCATKLLEEPQAGGVGGIPGPINGRDPFDPASVQANCGAGDPRQAQTNSQQPVGYKGREVAPAWVHNKITWELFGYGSYGGKGQDAGDGMEYIGLSKEDSQKEKKEAIDLALQYLAARDALIDQAKRETDPARKAALEAKAKAANEAYEKAMGDAQKDPNKKKTPLVNRTGPVSTCEQTLQAAREILYRCNRTGWKTAQCQSLAARMNHCPDPKYIYVDPGAGYSCGEKVDPKAVKDAWVARCEQNVKYGPGGTNPCEPPAVSGDGRYLQGKSGDICGDPRAYVDADSNACIATLEARTPFNQPGIQELIVWALDRLGGPIVVLPLDPKPAPKPPGPGPRPGPR